jgi:hypothetical protein
VIPMNKTRPTDRPYLIVEDGDWTYRVLRAYSKDPNAKFARWFCQVVTPYTGASGDLGDTYVTQVTGKVTYLDPEVPNSALPSWLLPGGGQVLDVAGREVSPRDPLRGFFGE